MDYQQLVFPYRHSPDQDAAAPVRHPVVVIGAGPVGLALAIDLAQQDVPVVLLDNDDRLSSGSRAICFAKRTLEIFDRLGCGQRMVDKGVSWNVGKVFFKEAQVYSFNLLPEAGHERPAFINLQQYYVEGYLADRAAELPLIDLRWKHAVSGIEAHDDHVVLDIDTPDGPYRLIADHVAACDGSRSTVRRLMGLESKGRTFKDRFLIADVKMPFWSPPQGRPKAGEHPLGGQRSVGAPFNERWFWFDPVFHPNQSVLLHKQPDDVWRIDFQLGWDADPEVEKRPEHIVPRVKALLGPDAEFTLEWASVYTFACLRMDSFQHGRVCFAGDSAHGVSPFGARGANSGVQDAENLAWKLAAVLQGRAPAALLDSYGPEREYAADENLLNSTRATDFITPKSEISRLFRDATLTLAKTCPFARTLVNSGRLSVPATLHSSPLNTDSRPEDGFSGPMVPGAPAADAPIKRNGKSGWLLRQLDSGCFHALVFEGPDTATRIQTLQAATEDLTRLVVWTIRSADAPAAGERALHDCEGLVAQRYDAQPGTVVLLRPDQHVCARWRNPDSTSLRAALRRALALDALPA